MESEYVLEQVGKDRCPNARIGYTLSRSGPNYDGVYADTWTSQCPDWSV